MFLQVRCDGRPVDLPLRRDRLIQVFGLAAITLDADPQLCSNLHPDGLPLSKGLVQGKLPTVERDAFDCPQPHVEHVLPAAQRCELRLHQICKLGHLGDLFRELRDLFLDLAQGCPCRSDIFFNACGLSLQLLHSQLPGLVGQGLCLSLCGLHSRTQRIQFLEQLLCRLLQLRKLGPHKLLPLLGLLPLTLLALDAVGTFAATTGFLSGNAN
mmetsp:Transcript_138084/g.344793  ORF Transcript_138084/g.344793 Transcript_138084/m.344793 type:complete len:212 (-) Transcript_138084:3226-3861(-)